MYSKHVEELESQPKIDVDNSPEKTDSSNVSTCQSGQLKKDAQYTESKDETRAPSEITESGKDEEQSYRTFQSSGQKKTTI